MSRRRGLQEGIVDRLKLRAVYRCLDCGLRFKVYAPGLAFRKTRKSETFSEYIGYGNEKDRAKLYNFVILAVLLLIVVVSMSQLKRKNVPARIKVDASGKQIR